MTTRQSFTCALISERVIQTRNCARRPCVSYMQVKLRACGISVLPGKAKIFKRILNELWKQFGAVVRFYYNPKFKFCVLEYPSHADAQGAIMSINRRETMVAAMHAVANTYIEEDRALVLRIFGLFFPESCFVHPIAEWNVNAEMFDLDVC